MNVTLQNLKMLDMILSCLSEGASPLRNERILGINLDDEFERRAYINKYIRESILNWAPETVVLLRAALKQALYDFPPSEVDSSNDSTIWQNMFEVRPDLLNNTYKYSREFFQEIWDLILSDESIPNPWLPRKMPDLEQNNND